MSTCVPTNRQEKVTVSKERESFLEKVGIRSSADSRRRPPRPRRLNVLLYIRSKNLHVM